MTSFADPGAMQPGGDLSQDVQVNLNADVSGYTQQVGAAQQATAGLAGQVDKLGASLGNLGKFAGRQLFHFSATTFAGLGVAVADAASLEHQLGTLRATSVVTGTSMRGMSDQMDKAFSKFPIARREVVQLYETIANLGVKGPKAVGSAADTFVKLGAVSGEDRNQLASGSLQLNRMMGNVNPAQVAGYANSLAVLSKNNGVAVSGITEFASAIAPMSRAAGIGQAAVQGIATAFQKAGADGAYAANTFNKIVTEISTLQQTGSPDIAKYATFTGKSAQQFKTLSPTEQATQVFEQIGKGGPEALSFMSSLGLGQRDIRAVQAVAQSGGLRPAIAESVGASTTTKQMDEGAEAAFSGLSDSAIEVGNEFTKLGELIGGPLLKPITALINVFGGFLSTVNNVVKALGPLPAIAATLAGALAIPAGIAVGHAGLIGTAALLRGGLGSRSQPRVSYRAGMAAGQAQQAGMTADEALALSAPGRQVAANTANWRTEIPFQWGLNRGLVKPPPVPGEAPKATVGQTLGSLAGNAWRGLLGTGAWLMNTSTQTNRDVSLEGPDKPANRGGRGGFPGLVESAKTGSVGKTAKAGLDLVTSTVSAGIDMVGELTGKAASLAAAGVKGPKPPPATATPPTPPTPPPAAAGGLLSKVGGLASGALGLLSGPGAIAATIGLPLVSGIIDAIKQGEEEKRDVSEALTGSSPYDQALDKTSTNLARFGDTLGSAADRLAKFADTPIEQVSTVTSADVGAVTGDYQVSDPKLTSLVTVAKAVEKNKGDPQTLEKALGAYLDSLAQDTGPITGDRATKIKQDMLASVGLDKSNLVDTVMTSFASRQNSGMVITPDTNFLAGLAGGPGVSLDDFKNIYGVGTTGLQAGTQDKGEEGLQVRMARAFSMAGTTLAGTGGAGKEVTVAEMLKQQLGTDPEQVRKELDAIQAERASKTPGVAGYTSGGIGAGALSNAGVSGYGGSGVVGAGAEAIGAGQPTGHATTPEQGTDDITRAALRTDQGKALLSQLHLTEDQAIAMAKSPPPMPPATASGSIQRLQQQGPLGQYAAAQPGFVQASVGTQAGNPGAQFAAATKLFDEAVKEANGSVSEAVVSLSTLANAMGGMSDATGALITQAAEWARKMMGYALPTMSTEQQLIETSKVAEGSFHVLSETGTDDATKEAKAAALADLDAAKAAEESKRQRAISQIVAGKAFMVQSQRAEQDNQIQIEHSNRDFGIQQARQAEDYGIQRQHAIEDYGTQRVRAEQAYNLQVLHAQQDYQTSSMRSREDYQTSVNRQVADHARDLKRQAQAAAQDIYDPYIRIQKKATTDAGTLIYNLTEQNADIDRQIKQISQLKDRGVSQQAIESLKLGDVSNAQQVTTLLQSLEQNPDMTGRINELIAKRQTGTTTLTQSEDNLGFKQQEEDYRQSLERGSEDFDKAMRHTAEDQEKVMARMSEAFGITSMQAAEDQAKSLDRMAEAYSRNTDRAVDDHARQLSDMADNYLRIQKRAAEDLATSLVEYSGTFEEIMTQLGDVFSGDLATLAPEAAGIVNSGLKIIEDAHPWITGSFSIPAPHQERQDRVTPVTPVQHTERQSRVFAASGGGGGGGSRAFAFGGISLTSQRAMVSEHGPELHLPLNSRGEQFMAGLIARSLAQGITAAISSTPSTSSSTSNDHSVSFAGADIQVVAQDPDAMARQLAAKAKLSRLASPVRH